MLTELPACPHQSASAHVHSLLRPLASAQLGGKANAPRAQPLCIQQLLLGHGHHAVVVVAASHCTCTHIAPSHRARMASDDMRA